MISATTTLRAMLCSEDASTRVSAQFLRDAFEAFSIDPTGNMEAVARRLRQAANFALDAADPQNVHINIVSTTPRRTAANGWSAQDDADWNNA